MSGKVFEEKNGLASTNCQKLYMDLTAADVNLVFKNTVVKVSAHKAVLAVGSPVFHTMFFGSLPEKRDILIKDATPEAFKEFLQFFYLDNVRLTSDNVFQVANLCKKYEVNNGLKLCEAPMMQSLTTNIMCTGYAMALLLEVESVIDFCERKIKERASDVLKSIDFLECDQKVFDKVLKLVSSKCSASEVVDASMAWSRAKCERENLEKSSFNLKAQLNSSFDRIPFADLDSEQFSRHTEMYKRFFTEDELEAIILKVMSKKANTNTLPPFHVLVCDRRLTATIYDMNVLPAEPHSCRFTLNTSLLLTGLFITESEVPMKKSGSVVISTDEKELALKYITIIPHKVTRVALSKPIVIEPNIQYEIVFKIMHVAVTRFKAYPHSELVDLRDGIQINFISEDSLIARLVFEQMNDSL